MPARLVTIAVTISVTIAVTMMFGRAMSSERARYSDVMSCIVARQLRLVGGISLTRRIAGLERRGKPDQKLICQAPRELSGAQGGLVWPAKRFPVGLEVVWSASCRCRER